MNMTAQTSLEPPNKLGKPSLQLVPPLDHANEDGLAFSPLMEGQPNLLLAGVAVSKRSLLDDLRWLVLQGVAPRQDELERNPTADSVALAERLVLSLPDDIAMPKVCLPDDGEITFSWKAVDGDGVRWRALLAVGRDLDVECFVRRSADHLPQVHFADDCGVDMICLPDDMVAALRAHWGNGDT